jgi:diguanylate cyclase (GGDEF)-like protein
MSPETGYVRAGLAAAALLLAATAAWAGNGTVVPAATSRDAAELLREARDLASREPARAIEVARRALETALNAGDRAGEGDARHVLGTTLDLLDRHDAALQNYLAALEIREGLGEPAPLASTLNNIGVVYQKLGRYSEALGYLSRARSLYESLDDRLGVAKVMQNSGVVYRQRGDYAAALAAFEEVLGISRALHNAYGAALASISIGNAHQLMGRADLALPDLERGLAAFRAMDDSYSVVLASIWLAPVYTALDRRSDALAALDEAESLASSLQAEGLLMDVYQARSDTLAASGQFEQALREHQRFDAMRSKVFDDTMSDRIAELHGQYEAEKKDREIAALRLRGDQEQLVRNLLLAGLAVALLLALLLGHRYRLRKRIAGVVSAKNRELELVDDIVQQINRESDLHRLLETLLGNVGTIVPQAQRSMFFLYEADRDRFELTVSLGFEAGVDPGGDFSRENLWERFSRCADQPLDDVFITHRYSAADTVCDRRLGAPPRSIIATYVAHEGQPIGMLAFDNMQVEGAFDVTDAERLVHVRGHAVYAILKAKAQAELQRAARSDGLTGLANRRYMMELIEQEAKRFRRSNTPFALVLGDIDNFKQFNDRYGHACGDRVLVHVADVLRGVIREQDCVARWGGEEFMFLLPDTDMAGALIAAEKIRARVAELPVVFEQATLSVQLTLGVAVYDGQAAVDRCIASADRALYRGKRSGRNRVAPAAPPVAG